ncbi:MAG: lipopolysaccharide biosynthesis protein [Deltaproteobacteria bacterium]|nr:lipopolysaccharide biosynthesis protein [Deltaproteobacteria bacterium]
MQPELRKGAAESVTPPAPEPAFAEKPAGRTRSAAVALAASYVGAVMTIVRGIILVPLYLSRFGVDVYGGWLASANVVGMLSLFDVGISSVVSQRLAQRWGAGDRRGFLQTSGAGLILIATICAVMVLCGIAIAPFIPRVVRAPEASHGALATTFALTALGAAGSIFSANVLAITGAWQRAEIGAVARLTGQIMETVVIVVTLLLGRGVIALGIGSLAGVVCNLMIAMIWTTALWRRLGLPRPSTTRTEIRELITTILPTTLSRIVLQIASNIEVALVSGIISPAAATAYALTDRILRVAMNFVNPIANAVLSGLSHFVGERGESQAVRPTRQLLGLWSLIVAGSIPALLAINEDFVHLWVGPSNYGGAVLNIALGLAGVLGAREFLLSIVLTSTGAIREAAWLATGEAIVRLPLMYVALVLLGSYGLPAASATISVGSLLIYGALVNHRVQIRGREGQRLQLTGMPVVIISMALAFVEAVYLPHALRWSSFIGKCALVGIAHLALAFSLEPGGRQVLMSKLLSRFPIRKESRAL